MEARTWAPMSHCQAKRSANVVSLPSFSSAADVLSAEHEQGECEEADVVVLVTGLDDDLARLTASLAQAVARSTEAFVTVIRAAHAPAALQACERLKPSVVVLGASLWSDERRHLEDLAMTRGASVITLSTATAVQAYAWTLVDALRTEVPPPLLRAG
jgi:hypothetical protein